MKVLVMKVLVMKVLVMKSISDESISDESISDESISIESISDLNDDISISNKIINSNLVIDNYNPFSSQNVQISNTDNRIIDVDNYSGINIIPFTNKLTNL